MQDGRQAVLVRPFERWGEARRNARKVVLDLVSVAPAYCERCGCRGAVDFMGDLLCPGCAEDAILSDLLEDYPE